MATISAGGPVSGAGILLHSAAATCGDIDRPGSGVDFCSVASVANGWASAGGGRRGECRWANGAWPPIYPAWPYFAQPSPALLATFFPPRSSIIAERLRHTGPRRHAAALRPFLRPHPLVKPSAVDAPIPRPFTHPQTRSLPRLERLKQLRFSGRRCPTVSASACATVDRTIMRRPSFSGKQGGATTVWAVLRRGGARVR